MKTYRNEQQGFEIDLPENWSFHSEGADHLLVFKCDPSEAFNIQSRPLKPVLTLEQTEDNFAHYAHEKGYTSLGLGRITIGGKEHVWARYYMGGGLWSKKYVIVLNEIQYAITATCLDQKFLLEMEKGWDAVASSFCLIQHKVEDKSETSVQKSEITIVPAEQVTFAKAQVLSNENIVGAKTYRNEKHGFEINVPESWSPPPPEAYEYVNALDPIPKGLQKDVFQYGSYEEAFNFEIAPLFPEPLLADTEVEFRLFARDRGFKDLRLGRIMVAGKEHVCASYFIHDQMGVRWNKKYMVVFGGVEYAITGTCNDPHWFVKREKDWDSIIRTFRLLKPVDDSINSTDRADRYRDKRRGIVEGRIEMRDMLGDLYARAYEAVSIGNFKEARVLLEKCLQENPDHVLAHKELALVLERLGDKKGAIAHRREVERLNPSDFINRSNLEKLLSGSDGGKLLGRLAPDPNIGSLNSRIENSPHVPGALDGTGDTVARSHTLAFSIRSYLLIAVLAVLYIQYKVGLKVLLALTSESHQPLSNFEFNLLSVILVLGIGAFVCLMFLLGVTTIGQSAEGGSFFNFIERTMQRRDEQKETIGEKVFSDFIKVSDGILNAVNLQAKSLVHASTKILLIPFSIGQVNRVMLLIFVLWLILPKFILDRPLPLLWDAIYFLSLYYFCYRALLFEVAKLKGVSKDGNMMQSIELTADPSLVSSVKFARTKDITPGFITEILNQETIINAIKNDLRKTDQIGYKEVWRLGLITPEQDWFDPRPEQASRLEGTKKFIKDINYRFKWLEQIPVSRTAALHSTGYFNIQLNNILISNGTFKHTGYPGWSYHLHTVLNKGEFIRIRNIQVETGGQFAENRSPSLAKFLREDGFPLKDTYVDGDPLTTERGGIIVFDKDRVQVTYPKYLTQRRLIDDEGNLVDLGIDEGFNLGGVIEVKMRPAELKSLVQYATSNGYTPILRYHSIPYASDFMVPILDAPISISGWADLFIDTRGKGKLFISREKTLDEWTEMMAKLRQLFYDELARKDYHLLGLSKDESQLNFYLSRKMEILKDYYIIQDWNLA